MALSYSLRVWGGGGGGGGVREHFHPKQTQIRDSNGGSRDITNNARTHTHTHTIMCTLASLIHAHVVAVS